MKTGLVLEGGGMRGIYTAGVLDIFMEKGIFVDGVLGVSAGSVHGASYVSGQMGRNIRYTRKYCKDWRFMSFWSLLVTGSLVGEKFSYEKIPYELDPFDFKGLLDSSMEFYACATCVETGRPEYFNGKTADEKRCLDIIRASSSMPLVSPMVEIDGKKYLDGGTADSIPLLAFQKMGYGKNIVVLTRPIGYRKGHDSTLALMQRKYEKYPEYIAACKNRYINYNESIRRILAEEQKGNTLVIAPSHPVKISRMENNPEIIQAQYDLGRLDALTKLEQINKFLEK